jgi:single-strand DNA-binding protein
LKKTFIGDFEMARGTVNKVIILGRVGQDPELKSTTNSQVVNLSIATNELGPKNENNQRSDTTEWHRVTIFGKMAENVNTYVKKGSLVYVEGRLQTNKWTDTNGVERYSTDIIANEVQFIGGQGDKQSSGQQSAPAAQQSSNAAPETTQAAPATQPTQQSTPAAPQNFDDFDDDIPF